MMQDSHAMPSGATHRLQRAVTKMIALFGVSTALSVSAFPAYGSVEQSMRQHYNANTTEQQEAVRPDEKTGSAISFEKEFLWMTSVEKACTMDVAQQVAQRLNTDETLRNALATHIGKIYRIGGEAARTIVETAVKVSDAHDVDPFIVLGIASVESSMNPEAQSNYGAAGLMQVYAPSHRVMLEELGVDTTDKNVAAQTLKRDLETNVVAGTLIYRQYLKQYKTVPMALQAYNGAKKDATKKYARKVLKKRDQYQQAMFAHAQIALAHAAIAEGHLGTGLIAGAMPGSPDSSVVTAVSGIADDLPRRPRAL